MNSKKSSSMGLGDTNQDLKMTGQALWVFMKEYDTLKDLFRQTENSIHGGYHC